MSEKSLSEKAMDVLVEYFIADRCAIERLLTQRVHLTDGSSSYTVMNLLNDILRRAGEPHIVLKYDADFGHLLGFDYQSPCQVPPPGWYCTRDAGHEGPCAAIPNHNLKKCRKEIENP